MLHDGLQVDLRVLPEESYGAALIYFTGSKDHCVHLRRIAQRMELSLNEYGLFRGSDSIAARTEEEVYRALGLDWIAPELREDRGEIKAAMEHTLPHLIERADLRGDLHSHSTYTDGRATIEQMALKARQAGLEYLAVTDHSQRLAMVNGLDPQRLREQWREIADVQSRVKVRLLRGIEVDILDDGTLDLPDDVLAELDWVVASVHSKISQPHDEMTRRLVKAIGNPHVDVIGHPNGRILIDKRAGSSFDFNEVARAAAGEGCALEVNSQAQRTRSQRHRLHRGQSMRWRQTRDLERLTLAQGFRIATIWHQPGAARMDRARRRSQHATAQGFAPTLGRIRLHSEAPT